MKRILKMSIQILCISFFIITFSQCKNNDKYQQIQVQIPIYKSNGIVTVNMQIPEVFDWEEKDDNLLIYDKNDTKNKHNCFIQAEIPQDILTPFTKYEEGIFLSQADNINYLYINEHYVIRGDLYDSFYKTYFYMYLVAINNYLFVFNTHSEELTDLENTSIVEHIISTIEIVDSTLAS